MLKNDAASLGSVDQLAPDGHPFELTELHNKAGMSVTLMDWGATWLSAILPLKGEKNASYCWAAKPPRIICIREPISGLPLVVTLTALLTRKSRQRGDSSSDTQSRCSPAAWRP